MAGIDGFTARTLRGEEVSLADYAGQVLLIVNTASKCGFTPQYAGLEALYRTYSGRGFAVLGFPCNQFGGQEPGGEAEIATFCSTTYDVTFPVFAKVEVNGPGAHPLFQWLKSAQPGSPQFRAALRDALENVKEVPGAHGIFSTSAKDHLGLDQRASVMVKIENGGWKYQQPK